MSLARFISFFGLGACLVLLQACGGWTVSQLQSDLQPELAKIELPNPGTRLEQLVLQELNQNILSNSDIKTYKLTFSVSAGGASTVAVRGTSSTLRTTTTTLTFTLVDKQTSETVLSDSLSASASSGAVSGRYAQEKSTQFSNERLAKLLADRLVQRLALFIANEKDERS